jgi:competence protein ComEA
VFDLERSEKFIVIFFVSFALAGAAFGLYKKSQGAVRADIKYIDLKSTDAPSTEESAAAGMEKVNINEAGLEELMKLKRVGRTLAQRIIDYRNSKGGFRYKEEIRNVKGLGQSTFEDIKDHIKVE